MDLPPYDHSARVLESVPAAVGPAVVTIHGMEEEWDVFEGALESVTRRALRLDMPWSGREGYEWALEPISVAERLEHALGALPVRPRGLIAHSFGTLASLHYLDRCGVEGLEAVVFISPFFLFEEERLDWERMAYLSAHYQRFLELAVEIRLEKALEPEIRNRMAEHIREKIGPEGCLEFLYHFIRTRRIALSNLRVPVLVIGGEEDFYSLPDQCRRIARELPSAEVEILSGCGHFSMIEEPAKVGARIARFFDQHSKGAKEG